MSIVQSVKKFIGRIKICSEIFLSPGAILLMDTPVHENLGDAAIALGEILFLKEQFPNRKIIEINSSRIRRFPELFSYIRKRQTVLIHGGGFLGTIWPEEEAQFEKILTRCCKNSVIVLPQTVFFEDSEEGQAAFERLEKVLMGHKDLTVCLREENSMKFFDERLPGVKHVLMPDMVLYLQYNEETERSNKAILCLREDRERVLDANVKHEMKAVCEKVLPEVQVILTDTVLDVPIKPFQREKFVKDKLRQFAGARLVVTDRLHGMILAALAGTPCVVLDNYSHKVAGVYRLLKDYAPIQCADDPAGLQEAAMAVLANADSSLNRSAFAWQFDKLAELIRSKNN